jgi:HD-GYP domain-containing protein (c-di-GMP phosphodiesterase class II)
MIDPVQQNEFIQVAAYLNAAVVNIRLYTADHPQVARYLERAFLVLRQTLSKRSDLTFMIVGHAVVVDNRPLTSRTPHIKQFARMLRASAVERITFTAELSFGELVRLAADLAGRDHQAVHTSPGIKLGKLRMPDKICRWGAMTPEIRRELDQLGVLADKPLDELRLLFDQVKTAKELPLQGLERVVQDLIQGMLCNINPLEMLSSLKSSDEYTFTHAINVCILTMTQAEVLGVEGRALYDIGVAAAMHDAGKMFVPDEILNKPGKLTEAEWELMRHHTIRGARYILRMEGLPRLAFIAALEHHIRFDGSGYPAMNGGSWRPHIVSQMIAVSDLYDAMRSRRPYQEPKPDEKIIQILVDESGSSFNPHLVDNFLRIIRAGAGDPGEI